MFSSKCIRIVVAGVVERQHLVIIDCGSSSLCFYLGFVVVIFVVVIAFVCFYSLSVFSSKVHFYSLPVHQDCSGGTATPRQ